MMFPWLIDYRYIMYTRSMCCTRLSWFFSNTIKLWTELFNKCRYATSSINDHILPWRWGWVWNWIMPMVLIKFRSCNSWVDKQASCFVCFMQMIAVVAQCCDYLIKKLLPLWWNFCKIWNKLVGCRLFKT
jgi:hypothetical protein